MKEYKTMDRVVIDTIMLGDCLDTLKKVPDKSVDCCITSPPYYGLRDYGDKRQIGLEETPYQYIERLTKVFEEVRRVLKDEGSLWLNIGDSYAGSGRGTGSMGGIRATRKDDRATFPKAYHIDGIKNKSLMGIPWRLAFSLMDSGWILRQDIIWSKKNVMPESVKDRFCKAHEYMFFFVKKEKYYFNHDYAIEEATGYDGRKNLTAPPSMKYFGINGHDSQRKERWPQRGLATKPDPEGLHPQHHGKNIETTFMRTMRDVWHLALEPSNEKHHAMFPQSLIRTPILCGCPEKGVVLDPFMGSGTTAIVAKMHFRHYIGCELNKDYHALAEKRIAVVNPLFNMAMS